MLSGRTFSLLRPAIIGAALAVLALPLPAHARSGIELIFPQDPLVTEFVSSYGAARSGGRSHAGNDLMAPKMTEVRAVAPGVVTTMKNGPRSGYLIIIEHAGGWESYYMHLNNDRPGTDDGRADHHHTYHPGIEVGSEVVAGQVIAYVGDSGNAEWAGPHTHFELHHGGRPVNPYPYLVEAYERALRTLEMERLVEMRERAA